MYNYLDMTNPNYIEHVIFSSPRPVSTTTIYEQASSELIFFAYSTQPYKLSFKDQVEVKRTQNPFLIVIILYNFYRINKNIINFII